jgi:hypothetical protein
LYNKPLSSPNDFYQFFKYSYQEGSYSVFAGKFKAALAKVERLSSDWTDGTG